jgi:hypothetical protein
MKFNRISLGFTILTILMAGPAIAGPHGPTPHAAKTGTPTPKPPTTNVKPTMTASHTTTSSPIAAKIASHPQLAAKLTPLLPKGMTLEKAAAGFKNQGQFIAALHVSRNLNIPFAKLKTEMTGREHESLGQAIHELRPRTDATRAAKHAETEAAEDAKIHS